MNFKIVISTILVVLGLDASMAAAQPSQQVSVDTAGTLHLPPMDLPLSSFMSEKAKQYYVGAKSTTPPGHDTQTPTLTDTNGQTEMDNQVRPLVERGKALYLVSIEARTIGGVPVEVITPKGGVAARNRGRALINLHCCGFIFGGPQLMEVDAIPIAATAKIEVVSVDYREAPKYKFPAAQEDVAAVYRALLKTHRPQDIGIYGSSAGGMLSAQMVVWFQKHGLPRPGAIAMIGVPVGLSMAGDSAFLQFPIGFPNEAPIPPSPNPRPIPLIYFDGADPNDPMIRPILSPEALSKFPPTLLIAGTRDTAMSAICHWHEALSEAGVDSDLHVWDGMWHSFLWEMDMPESIEGYRVITRFFDRNLGRKLRTAP
jgi:acetyl esterase/lipase